MFVNVNELFPESPIENTRAVVGSGYANCVPSNQNWPAFTLPEAVIWDEKVDVPVTRNLLRVSSTPPPTEVGPFNSLAPILRILDP